MSALFLANDRAVLRMRMNLPLSGVWWADVILEDGAALDGFVKITTGLWDFNGTVARSATFGGSVIARIKGGAGGMANAIGPQAYVSPAFSVPWGDILSKSEEKASRTADAALLGTVLEAFHIQQTTCGRALSQLCGVMGANWRVLPSGTIWVGFDSWTEFTAKVETISADPHLDTALLNVQEPSILPGTTLHGRRISRVEYRLDAGGDLEAAVAFHGDD